MTKDTLIADVTILLSGLNARRIIETGRPGVSIDSFSVQRFTLNSGEPVTLTANKFLAIYTSQPIKLESDGSTVEVTKVLALEGKLGNGEIVVSTTHNAVTICAVAA
jgi:hypothetical protein